MARYKRTILATCCVPWDENYRLDEDLFRSSIRDLLHRGFRDLYVFGTAGEGHNVSDSMFERIVDVFIGEVIAEGETPMVGVINLSLFTTLERIEYAAGRGCRVFQISLPNWGELNDHELFSFFREVCGRYPELQFLHYNLARAGRIVKPREYAILAEEHSNLVATKYGAGDPEMVNGLLEVAGSLRHFFTELGFFYGSAVGECGLLASISSTHAALARRYYEAAAQGDTDTLVALYRDLASMMTSVRAVVGPGPHLDGAYDKIFAKINDTRFPLRLLPPFEGSTEEAYQRYREILLARFPQWIETTMQADVGR
jgi:dihydrodipicolinate synthase/N-acetylneuraminate lyase